MKAIVFAKYLLCATVVLLLSVPTTYSQSDKDIEPFATLRQSFGNNLNYLEAINGVSRIEDDCKTPDALWKQYLQSALTANSFVFNNPNTDSLLFKFYDTFSNNNVETLNILYENKEAYAEIIKQASAHQVVMINELHWYPQHRYVVNHLLKDFYAQGFRYLAIEAIWEDTDTLSLREYPVKLTGFYTLDPCMANLIRNAIDAGFKIVAYDDFNKDRELGQAKNLYEQTIKRNPNAKVLVYAGGDHINKLAASKKMAYHFNRLSKIAPFVIKQGADYIAYKTKYQGVAIIENTDTASYNMCLMNGIRDNDFLVKPHVKQSELKVETLVGMALDRFIKDEQFIVSIYMRREYHFEGLKAVPIANYLINDNLKNRIIKLPKGNYTTLVRDCTGDILHEFNYTVKTK